MLIKQELNFFSVRFSLFVSVSFLLLIASSISSSPYLSFHFSVFFLFCNKSLPYLLSSFFLCVLSSLLSLSTLFFCTYLYIIFAYFLLIFFCTAFFISFCSSAHVSLCLNICFSLFVCLFVCLFVRSSLPCSFLFFLPSLLS